MPEPLVIATGVTALVHGAYTLCFSIYQTVDGIASAPKHIKAISRDLKAFYSVLGTLKGYIDDAETSLPPCHVSGSRSRAYKLRNHLQRPQQRGQRLYKAF